MLGGTLRWTEQGAVLDTDLLFGNVLADREKTYVGFKRADFATAIERGTLARTPASGLPSSESMQTRCMFAGRVNAAVATGGRTCSCLRTGCMY